MVSTNNEFKNRCRRDNLFVEVTKNSEIKGVFMGSMSQKRSGLKRGVAKEINKVLQER